MQCNVDTICTYMDKYMQAVINIGSIVYDSNFQVCNNPSISRECKEDSSPLFFPIPLSHFPSLSHTCNVA